MRKCSDGALDSDGKNGGFIEIKALMFYYLYSSVPYFVAHFMLSQWSKCVVKIY